MGKKRNETINLYVYIRRLAMSLLAALFVIYAFLVLSKAWFKISKTVTATGKDVNIIGTKSLDYNLYKWDYSADDWFPDPVDVIDMNPAVPNETQKYKVECTDPGDVMSSVLLELSTFALPDATTSDELYDFIDITYGDTHNQVLSDIPSNSYKYVISAPGSNSCIFELHISKDVCNFYSDWGMTGKLSIQ